MYDCIDKKIDYLSRKVINKRKQQILRNEKHHRALSMLHDKYVLVPADKASNNIIVIRKKYYLEVMLKEFVKLGVPK